MPSNAKTTSDAKYLTSNQWYGLQTILTKQLGQDWWYAPFYKNVHTFEYIHIDYNWLIISYNQIIHNPIKTQAIVALPKISFLNS